MSLDDVGDRLADAFFQVKNIRRTAYALAADELELMLLSHDRLPVDARTSIGDKIRSYRDVVQLYSSDPKTQEGLDELFARAKEFEHGRDRALRKDPYFDFAQALLQIAIVLASVAIIAITDLLAILNFMVAAMGTAMMFA